MPFINPGIKIGYQFGNKPSFLIGIETSIGAIIKKNNDKNQFFAGVFGYQYGTKVQCRYIYYEVEGGIFTNHLITPGFAIGYNQKTRKPYVRPFLGYTILFASYRIPLGNDNHEFSITTKPLPIFYTLYMVSLD